jgi:hypothetical protein
LFRWTWATKRHNTTQTTGKSTLFFWLQEK